ncbi:ABC transporter permease subunit [Amycolatopsis taiwanensis]|uniref:ABC transporter permease n=1 Tax=Amycolatopsis taiwanensis TaxID=342230 RepID=A0A9W6R3L0_9PSEU|nr:ABC transporter permease subunit [Amycolatopsis taiwanensis]GLY68206.1 ABC transporter permease [Amycolatopsis taiwanensis]
MTTLTAPAAADASMPPGVKVTHARVAASEWAKFFSLRSSYLVLAATVLVMAGFGVLFSGVTANRFSSMSPAELAKYDPTATSLRGVFMAQLTIGVLGVLTVTGEYATGMIRSSVSAAPRRLPLVWAKLIVFGLVSGMVCTASAFGAFFLGQALLNAQHAGTTLAAPGVFRAVLGTGLYLTVVGLIGVALGWIVRHTAGAIATLFGVLLILPPLMSALPDSWGRHINPYLPTNAGQEVLTVHPEPGMLAPWNGFVVFCLYLVLAVAAGAISLRRRDV